MNFDLESQFAQRKSHKKSSSVNLTGVAAVVKREVTFKIDD